MEREAREAKPPSMNLLSEWYGKCFMHAIPFGLCQPSDEQLSPQIKYTFKECCSICLQCIQNELGSFDHFKEHLFISFKEKYNW